jgi:hypothetical protein
VGPVLGRVVKHAIRYMTTPISERRKRRTAHMPEGTLHGVTPRDRL